MKIACIGTGWYPERAGGLEKYVFGMTHALLDAGDDIDLFVTGCPQLTHERGRAYALNAQDDGFAVRMRDARRTFARSLRGKYDVINVHFAMNALPLYPFIKHDTPRIVHFHGPWAAESAAEGGGRISVAIKELLERYIYKHSDRFIVLSSAFKDVLTSYGISPSRVHVIPMGIDVTTFLPASNRAALRAELKWPLDTPVFFTARRLVNRVGVDELLRAAEIVRGRGQKFSVKIAGKGPLEPELRRKIEARALQGFVELLGFVPEEDLVRAYQAADVTILPTQSLEGFGTVIAESLACGTPVLATPIGGMPEALEGLSPGSICTSAAPHDIAERMSAALSGALRLPESDACRQYAVERFAWPTVAGKIRRVFSPAAFA